MQMYKAGDDVVVDIKDKSRYAYGYAEKLNNRTGRVLEVRECSIDSGSVSCLVQLDKPIEPWQPYQQIGPVEEFWFSYLDLAY